MMAILVQVIAVTLQHPYVMNLASFREALPVRIGYGVMSMMYAMVMVIARVKIGIARAHCPVQ